MDTPWQQRSKEASFLRSALTTEGQFHQTADIEAWFRQRRAANRFVVQQIPFAGMDQWAFVPDPERLAHRSGRFFTIEGLRVQTNYGSVATWDQPIINQPEIGILGIITKVFNGVRYFLMQAKMEPGNVNILQLSPTVQATRSNYTQVHQGKRPRYLEYFLDRGRARILVDQLQSEQGARFLRKRNRNMIVEVEEEILLYEDFRWLTLGQLKHLLRIDNLVNMDARTVLSCIPFVNLDWKHYDAAARHSDDEPLDVFDYRLEGFARDLFVSMLDRKPVHHNLDEIISWFTELKTRYELHTERIPLNAVQRWIRTDYEIRHETGQYFSVMAVSVEAGNREVISWTQPLLKHSGRGVVGFITRKFGGTLHFLVRAAVEPGMIDLLEMGPTVSCSGAAERLKQPSPPPFLEYFMNAPTEQIRYAAVQSEEGGRFYHFQNRYMIIELPPDTELALPDNFIWLTLGQLIDFTKYSYVNIEARNLLSCLNFAA